MTHLTDATDDVLDASLARLYAQHEAATDPQARAEIHWAIAQVLGEQSRRLDVWIEEHVTA
jgi:acyl-CoA reductase-like NAD-dependent aldehyde dehydrogenase